LANFGNLSVAFALTFAVYAAVALFYGASTRRRDLVKSGEYAVYVVFLFTTMAVVALEYLLITSDMTVEYVANYSNRDLNLFYKIAALWGGQKGSLLFWSWVVTLYGAVAVLLNRRYPGKLVPYMLAIVTVTSAFFLVINKFAANPFGQLVVDHGDGTVAPFEPADGRGLNPLLQHPAMVIHPPLLYLGYIGFVIPFSFCLAALLTRELGSAWIRMARRWTLTAWLFLGAGILLGGKWAYVELGWGGYWAWDPVENASLLPWLTGTAFLHSVIVQERKNMLKVWNVTLIITTYMLCIFGTFITRSGVVSSVHAFAQSSIGNYFAVFLVLMAGFSIYLVFSRLDILKSENQLDSWASREASFLLNNLILLAACFAVLWGTIFPMISELIQGEQITVGAPYFNRINVPIGLFLLFLTGVGPLLAWRKTSVQSMKRIFLWPVIGGIFTAIVSLAAGVRSIYPVMSFSLATMVTITILNEFYRAGRARMRSTGDNFLKSVLGVLSINRRRYGGYIVHFGFVLLVIGFTGQAFTTEGYGEVNPGDKFVVGDYEFECEAIEEIEDPNWIGLKAVLNVTKNGREFATLEPEKRYYMASEQPTSEVRIESGLREDVYVVFAGVNEDDNRTIIQVWINPLVAWVWIGGIILAAGTLYTMLPNSRQRRAARDRKTLDRLLRASELARKAE
jgi:cytochrome c-type biogenesis protein CcmF